jgi:hypothetical protein
VILAINGKNWNLYFFKLPWEYKLQDLICRKFVFLTLTVTNIVDNDNKPPVQEELNFVLRYVCLEISGKYDLQFFLMIISFGVGTKLVVRKRVVCHCYFVHLSLAAEGHLKEEDGRGFTELLYLPDLQALLLGLSSGSLLQAHHLLYCISDGSSF